MDSDYVENRNQPEVFTDSHEVARNDALKAQIAGDFSHSSLELAASETFLNTDEPLLQSRNELLPDSQPYKPFRVEGGTPGLLVDLPEPLSALGYQVARESITYAEKTCSISADALDTLVRWSTNNDGICALVFANPYLNWLLLYGPILPTAYDLLDMDTPTTELGDGDLTMSSIPLPPEVDELASGGGSFTWTRTAEMTAALHRATRRINFYRRATSPAFLEKHGDKSRLRSYYLDSPVVPYPQELKERLRERTLRKQTEPPPSSSAP